MIYKELGSDHFHLYNKKQLSKLKISDFSWTPVREQRLQGKPTPQNLERKSPESYIQNVLTWTKAARSIN